MAADRLLTVDYAAAARLEGVAYKTITGRVAKGTLGTVETGEAGRNGKSIRHIPLQSLSPLARQRFAEESAPPIEHVREVAQPPSAANAPAALSEHNIPVLASDPRRVWEAGLIASWPAHAAETFFTRRRIITQLQLDLATATHGQTMGIYRRFARDHDAVRSVATLRRWWRRYQEIGEPALVPKWKQSFGSKTIPKPLQAQLEAFYSQASKPTIAQCYRYANDWWCTRLTEGRCPRCARRLVADDTGLADCPRACNLYARPSYWAVQRHTERCLSERRSLIEGAREGKKHFDDKFGFHVTRDASELDLGECAVLDHRCNDVHVILPNGKYGRPWVSAIGDIHSGDVAWVLREQGTVNSDAIASVFRRYILGFQVYDVLTGEWIAFPAHGVPAFAYVDHGKDYQGKRFDDGIPRDRSGKPFSPKHTPLDAEHEQTLFGTLGIQRVSAIPKRARSKAAEAWFKSYVTRIENLVAGWCGNAPHNKPADLDRRRRNGELLHWTQFIGVFARNMQQWRHERPIGDRELPPAAYWHGRQVDTPDPADLDLLLLHKERKRVRGGGITIEWGSESFHYMLDDPAFAVMGGLEVDVWCSRDDTEAIIAVGPNGQRWTLPRVDLRGESWHMMRGHEPGANQKAVMSLAGRQGRLLTAYKQMAAEQLDPHLADPTASLRVAADNGRGIRAHMRNLNAEHKLRTERKLLDAPEPGTRNPEPDTAPAKPDRLAALAQSRRESTVSILDDEQEPANVHAI